MSIVSEAGESVLYSGVTFRLTSPVLWLKLRAPASAANSSQAAVKNKQAVRSIKYFFSIAFLSLNRPERIARQLLAVIIADNC